MESVEENKEIALPGTLPTKIEKAFIAGEYVNLMALWDRDVAKARVGYPSYTAPKAVDEWHWD